MLTVAQPATADVPTSDPGVPITWSSAASAIASVELATLLQSYVVQQQDEKWGLFLSGSPVFTSGRVRAVELQQQYRKSDAPIENGAFISYNKVRIPRQIMLEMLCDGSSFSYGDISAITDLISTVTGSPSGAQIVRSEFLALLESVVADLNLYQVTTPEAVYQNMNVTGYRFRRSAERGLSLLYVELLLEEVRLIPAAQPTQAAQPQGQPVQSTGNVQSAAPTSAQLIAQEAGIS